MYVSKETGILVTSFSLPLRMDGQLEFWDVGDTEDSVTLMNRQEHTMATDLEWDPTGRYVVTSISFWSQKVLRSRPQASLVHLCDS